MKTNSSLKILLVAGLMSATALPAFAADPQPDGWIWDASIYALGAGMTGDVTVHGIKANLDLPFSKIMDNLQFGAMGTLRASKGPWAMTTDVVYMGLGATSQNGINVDLDQWMVEPTLSYRVDPRFELLAGARYNSIKGQITVPFASPSIIKSGTQEWVDAIVGAKFSERFADNWSFDFRFDIGGLSSDLTWQMYPAFNWHFSQAGLLQLGYRWLYTDYSTGSGTSLFHYDVMTEGPQVGLTFRF